jgi:pimeloyl-ACP methyl ester carboxylesterase
MKLHFFLGGKNRGISSTTLSSEKTSLNMETVKFKTKDGIEVVGDYYEAPDSRGALLLHMMPATRKSWTAFAPKLQQAGFKVLAIDLRGHGESQGGPNGYQKFSDEEHQASRLDVEAGAAFLKEKGVAKLYLVGASIGANLALRYLAEHPDIKSAVLLSPGLDYRGVITDELVGKLKDNQAVYGIASEDDKYSFDTVKKLFEGIAISDKRAVRYFKNAGHGTEIFEKEPQFMGEIVEWLRKN